MSGTSVQVPHREYFQGACIPDGYTQVKAPPKKWALIIDGKRITPAVIQKTLLKCQAANVDLEYVAKCLGVGGYAITEYLKSEKAIPQSVAHKFIWLFTSDAPLPKNPPPKPKIDWGRVTKSANVVVKTVDFDAPRLAKRFIQERLKRGAEWKDIAREINSTTQSIRQAEEGQILNQYGEKSVICRMCKLYGMDIREYETKPRIDFKAFQKRIYAEKEKRPETWAQIADKAGISERLLNNFKSYARKRGNIVYLTAEMEAVLNVLGIDKNEVLDRRA